jgi:hypothetical protein
MRRFRLSTLMLLIVIAALSIALVVRERRAARREAELRAEIANLRFRPVSSLPAFLSQQKREAVMRLRKDHETDLIRQVNRQLSGQ